MAVGTGLSMFIPGKKIGFDQVEVVQTFKGNSIPRLEKCLRSGQSKIHFGKMQVEL